MSEELTGRYRLKAGFFGGLYVEVEIAGYSDYVGMGVQSYYWRTATKDDLKRLEPMVADGWRFPEERNGTLDNVTGRRCRD